MTTKGDVLLLGLLKLLSLQCQHLLPTQDLAMFVDHHNIRARYIDALLPWCQTGRHGATRRVIRSGTPILSYVVESEAVVDGRECSKLHCGGICEHVGLRTPRSRTIRVCGVEIRYHWRVDH
ncbi:hypothetical protein HYQ46_001427 [Verticillium longisporum]|nr:hypothetical protein HYQ46_001427 [Verticillium longisporum]